MREAREDRDIECPEAQAIKANMDTLASRLTGSLVYIANAAYAKGLLLPQEKDIIDPNASKDRIYASKMLDEVGEKIKKKPEVYDKFIKILKELGGILTDISDEMSKFDTCTCIQHNQNCCFMCRKEERGQRGTKYKLNKNICVPLKYNM